MEEKEVRERDGDIVSLNVGGAGFATSRGTLIKVRGAPHSDRSPDIHFASVIPAAKAYSLLMACLSSRNLSPC